MSHMRSLFVAAEKFPKLNDDSRNFKIRGKRLHLGGSMILKTASEKKTKPGGFFGKISGGTNLTCVLGLNLGSALHQQQTTSR